MNSLDVLSGTPGQPASGHHGTEGLGQGLLGFFYVLNSSEGLGLKAFRLYGA